MKNIISTEYTLEKQFLNTIVLNQRGRAFTEQDISVLVKDKNGISAETIHRVLVELNKRGLIDRVGNKYYTKVVVRHKNHFSKSKVS